MEAREHFYWRDSLKTKRQNQMNISKFETNFRKGKADAKKQAIKQEQKDKQEASRIQLILKAQQ